MARGELPEFAFDSDGRLNAYGGKSGYIWVPPDAQIGSRPDEKGFMMESIVYPLPEDWRPPVGMRALSALKKAGWDQLEDTDTTRILENFILLANATPDMIKQFVLKWGPLWRCIQHQECFWRDHEDCLWSPAEPLDAFRSLAEEAKAALDIADHLKKDRPAPLELWQPLRYTKGGNGIGWTGSGDKDFSLWAQKFFLANAINRYLTQPSSGAYLYVEWNNQKAELGIKTGTGFIGVVWLMIAQCLTEAKGVYFCASCGISYIRYMRKPQDGRKNFCPDCSKKGKGSKRLYERSKRVHANKS